MGRYICALACLLATLPADAERKYFDWWLIHGEGEKPSRVLVFADAGSVQSRMIFPFGVGGPDIPGVNVRAEEVFESADSAHNIKYTYEIACERNTMRAYVTSKFWRDGRSDIKSINLSEPGPNDLLQPPKRGSWEERLVTFACDPEQRTLENNMIYMGGKEIHASIIAWTLWPDGKEPPFTNRRPVEERRAENLATLERMRAENAAFGRELTTTLTNQIEEESRREARMARWPKDGRGTREMRRVHTGLLEPTIGMQESVLLSRFGRMPSRAWDADGQRWVVFDFSNRTVHYNQFGGVGHVQQDNCLLTYLFENGKAIDYSVSDQTHYCYEALKRGR